MKNNPEDIPMIIFDLLERKSFAGLAPEEKKEVSQYFSQEEYEILHQDILNIRFTINNQRSDGYIRKHELMNKFEKKYPVTGRRFEISNISWKAAAIFLFLGTGWLSHYLTQNKNTGTVSQNGSVDTVYITKEVLSPPVKIYDTVYTLRQPSPGYQQKNIEIKSRGNVNHINVINRMNDQTNILNINEADNKVNNQKGNSMKEDPLLRKFTFVTL